MDIQFFTVFFLPLLYSCLVTALITLVCIPLYKKIKLVDDPKLHKHPGIIHTRPIPRGGGLPMVLGIVLVGFFILPITKITIALLIAVLLSLVVGLLDDKYDLSPYARFGINLLAAGVVVGSGVGIPFITNPLGGVIHLDAWRLQFSFFGLHSIIIFSDILALLWIAWVMNMLNWSKGVDGQMPGIVAISAFVIGLVSLRFITSDPTVIISAKLSFLITGSALGFLFFNYYPAKIFPGYSATAIYLLLSVVSILSGAKLATALLVMGVPMVDGLFTIVRRIGSGKSPFWHDKKHLHHLLLQLGFSQRSIALFYWIISAILGTIALSLTSQGKLFAISMLFVVVTGALLLLHKLRKQHE